MSELNLPQFVVKVKKKDGKDYIYDRLRKRFVRLTPEEYVRQHFVNFLIEYRNYPESLMSNEVHIEVINLKKRCDTVVHDKYLNPLMIIEYKSPDVIINQQIFDQIARYNIALKVPRLIVSNGMQHFCCTIDYENQTYRFVKDVPFYEELS